MRKQLGMGKPFASLRNLLGGSTDGPGSLNNGPSLGQTAPRALSPVPSSSSSSSSESYHPPPPPVGPNIMMMEMMKVMIQVCPPYLCYQWRSVLMWEQQEAQVEQTRKYWEAQEARKAAKRQKKREARAGTRLRVGRRMLWGRRKRRMLCWGRETRGVWCYNKALGAGRCGLVATGQDRDLQGGAPGLGTKRFV